MNTAVAPGTLLASQVKVNVRLCGSIPRQELESLSLKQQQLQQNWPSHERHSQYMSSSSTTASLNAPMIHDSLSLLTAVNQDEEDTRLGPDYQTARESQSFPSRRPPTFEAPSWAVPASGETRLEVSTNEVLRAPHFCFAVLLSELELTLTAFVLFVLCSPLVTLRICKVPLT